MAAAPMGADAYVYICVCVCVSVHAQAPVCVRLVTSSSGRAGEVCLQSRCVQLQWVLTCVCVCFYSDINLPRGNLCSWVYLYSKNVFPSEQAHTALSPIYLKRSHSAAHIHADGHTQKHTYTDTHTHTRGHTQEHVSRIKCTCRYRSDLYIRKGLNPSG